MKGGMQQANLPEKGRVGSASGAAFAATPNLDRLIDVLSLAVARQDLQYAQRPALTPDASRI